WRNRVLPLAYVALLQGARRALSCSKMAAAVRIGKCEKVSSVLSHVKCRIQALKFDACIIGSELPIYRGFHLIAARLPRGYFRRHLFPAVDTPGQALSDHHVDFDFGDVEPTAMLGRKDELEAIP